MEQLHQVADASSALRLPEQAAAVGQSAPQAAAAAGAVSAQSPIAYVNQAAPAIAAAGAQNLQPVKSTQPAQSTQSAQSSSAPQGMSLIAAVATVSTGRSMITDMVFGADNQVTQIRVIDPSTNRVIASTPPDTIARFEREVAAYQQVAREAAKNP